MIHSLNVEAFKFHPYNIADINKDMEYFGVSVIEETGSYYVERFDIEEGLEPVLTTFPLVMLKQTGKYGTLVVLWEDNPNKGHVAHESGHVAITMLSELGVKLHADNQEPITYMIGWVADKIHEVLSGKFKED